MILPDTAPEKIIASGLRLEDYHYALPTSCIAKYPLAQRDHAKMMVLNRADKTIAHRHFYDLPEFLQPGDLVVVNNTRVMQARLWGHRVGYTGRVQLLLLYPDREDPLVWHTLMKPTRKLPPGTMIAFPNTEAQAEVLGLDERVQGRLRFHLNGVESVNALMETIGQVPIPPYLSRDAVEEDKVTYQTHYAKDSTILPGSKAAPTAGLHFTPQVLEALRAQGVGVEEVTLSVSTGTFRSVSTEDITQHQMDPEHYTIPQHVVEAIAETKANNRRVIAIGTTATKTLESSAYAHNGHPVSETAWSELFIYPGFQFQVVDSMLTNFHLPKTTLLMLISAFSDREFIFQGYQEALAKDYRFFSYGDCMLIL